MKKKLALFIASHDTSSIQARALEEWAEGHGEYTRISEYHTIEFEMRPPRDYVPDQVKNLREKQDKIRTEAGEKMQTIEDAIGTLQAIEYIPGD